MASLATAGVALAVLAGWALDLEPLKRIRPTWVAMNPVTALTFLAAAAALWLQRRPANLAPAGSRPAALAPLLAGLVAGVGAAKLGEHAGWLPPGLDQWLFASRLGDEPGLPRNEMAPNTAFAFLLTGLALLLLDRGARERTRPAEWLAAALALAALVALLGYAYQVPRMYGIGRFIPMAAHTALLFLLLALGLLCARPLLGTAALFLLEHPRCRIARRLLVGSVLLVAAAGWLRLHGERAGFYGMETGVTLYTASVIALFVLLMAGGARALSRADQAVRALNAELQASTEQLRQANRELEAFSYTISHDLRAPLRHIHGYARMLQEDAADRLDGDCRRWLDEIGEAARRMGALIDDLLAFSRLGRKPLERTRVDMAALAAQVAAELDDGGRVRIAPLPEAHADPALLRQVWVNLLSNALKYSAPRGAEARVEVEGERMDGRVRYRVRDNGVGFDMKYADKLFGVFQRLHTADEFEGTGVGLAIVQRIVARHGGTVSARAEPGRGAEFTFELPLPPDTAPEPAA
ncbi:sensor histidine kinase [Vulcaniibacterium gelatinicum]|uniref:sensor histidine kinase n=1 Tax=Vulcaniibacterium gelatinicum TaxID=2598725 RepID=UPI0011C88B84|nr:ATP-binding protein [Vulcaniibacterium gelatinicum]